MFNVGMPAKLPISSVSLLPGNFWSQKEQPVIWKLETMSPRGSSKRDLCKHGPLTRYIKLRVAHAAGMPETFSPPPTSKETASYRSEHASRHVRHARAVMHAGIANPRWRGKRSRHSRRMHNPQFYVSGKRPMPSQAKISPMFWNIMEFIVAFCSN